MNYGDATLLTQKLQDVLKDEKNVVVKKSAEEGSDQFMACARRISFSGSVAQTLIDFATDNEKQIVFRLADPEVCPEEKYEPLSGEWKYENLIAVIY